MSTAVAHSAPAHLRIKGVYAHLDSMLTGIDRLKKAGIGGFDVVAPLPRHEIEEMVYEGRPSPVRWWTLTGAMSGVTTGLLISSLSHLDWPMINPGGKPTVSLAPFAIAMFECTILFGTMFTLLGMAVHSGLPSFFLDKSIQDPRYTDDKFGIVFTRAHRDDEARIVDILRNTGAIEVTSGDDAIYEVPNE
jgi:molybdopterin-containing oxidoreductase family membrane subunit